MSAMVHCPYRFFPDRECRSSFMGEDHAEAQASLDQHVKQWHPEEADRACEIIERQIFTTYERSPLDFEYDPGGNLCALVGQDHWLLPSDRDAALIEQWCRLGGEKLHQQSDEPDWDAPTAAETRERAINDYLRLK